MILLCLGKKRAVRTNLQIWLTANAGNPGVVGRVYFSISGMWPKGFIGAPHGQAGGLCPFFLPLRQSVGSLPVCQGGIHKDYSAMLHNLYKASPLTALQLSALLDIGHYL